MAGRTGKPTFPRSKYAEPVVLLTIKKATAVPKTSMKAPRSSFPFIKAYRRQTGNNQIQDARRFANSRRETDRKSTRLNSSHVRISYAVFCLKKKRQPCDMR